MRKLIGNYTKMKHIKTFFFTILIFFRALSANAQTNSETKLIGIWTSPYTTGNQRGSLILDFKSDNSIKITRSVTIDNVANAAFNQISGKWSVNGSILSIIPESTDGKFKWTNSIAQQILLNEISQDYADMLYANAKQNLPKLNTLHFASKMQIKQITESKLVLLNVKDSKTLTFTRIAAYPKGGKLKPKQKEESSIETHTKSAISTQKTKVSANDEPKPFGTDIFDNNNDDLTMVREIKNEVDVEEKKLEPEKIWTGVEESPKFPGGDTEMYSWLSCNIRYPEQAAKNNIQGRVTVQFVVEKDGSIGEVKVVRGKDPELDAEAIRVVKSFPKFIPGKINGQSVRTWFTLPISFRLSR